MALKVTNPICSRAEWDEHRERCLSNPGAYHGEIAKREIYWFLPEKHLWIKKNESRPQRWRALSVREGKPVDDPDIQPEFKPWDSDLDRSQAPYFLWFEGGLTNACFNEVDAHVLDGYGEEIAFFFEGEGWDDSLRNGKGDALKKREVSRKELLIETMRYARILVSLGLRKGDRIVLNMPNILEQIFFVQAAKRIGVIYSCVFSGLSAKTLADRLCDTQAKVLITVDGFIKNGQMVKAKEDIADRALKDHLRVQDVVPMIEDSKLSPESQKYLKSLLEDELTVERVELDRYLENARNHFQELAPTEELRIKLSTLTGPEVKTLVVENLGLKPQSSLNFLSPREFLVSELLRKVDAEMMYEAQKALGHQVNDLTKLSSPDLAKLIERLSPVVPVEANFPLFIMYTSGSTGKPKGLVHVHGGYVAGVAHTMRVCFNVDESRPQVAYVIADPAWITGQSYMITAALVTRTTSIIAEGAPIYPRAGRFASIIERYGANILKAGSTFLRSVASDPANMEDVRRYDLSTLKVATFCAEPTSPAIQEFGMREITPRYINSYWATEHGGIIFSHFFGSADFELRSDAKTYPMPWISAEVWVADDKDIEFREGVRPAAFGERGDIVLTEPYPYLARTIWGDGENVLKKDWKGDISRFLKTYFPAWAQQKGKDKTLAYVQGDYACSYQDMSFSFHGRSDEVIKVAGHRIGTEEIEGAILKDKLDPRSPVSDVIVVGAPDSELGSVPVAFLKTIDSRVLSQEDFLRLNEIVRREKGEIAIPSSYIPVKDFPETRNGKYMRRYLKKLLAGEPLGDTTTLKNPEAIEDLRLQIHAWKTAKASQEEVDLWLPTFESLPTLSQKRSFVREKLTRSLAKVLDPSASFKENSFDLNVPFRDLGLNSVRALQFTNMIKKSLGATYGGSIPVSLTFDYPDLKRLEDYLCDEIFKLSPTRKPNRRSGNSFSKEPIAIVGMACRFPGGVTSPEEFWTFLSEGKNAVESGFGGRWKESDYFDADPDAEGKIYCPNMGLLRDVDKFDAGFFGISTTEARALDPQQRLLLETSWEALERACIRPESIFGTATGVFVGMTTREYYELLLKSPERNRLEPYVATGTSLNTAAGRISYVLGLNGPTLTVDTACSSSLVALHLACQSLNSGECDLALSGGANLILTPHFSVSLSKARALSPSGFCKTFDEQADGYVRSEGCAMLVLKRLSDARESKDPVLAVIAGSAVNQDGKSSGLTAPNGRAQEDLLRQALDHAKWNPNEVSYIEAHGTGTPLGDPIEVRAIGSVYKEGRASNQPLTIGSVKTNIGHTESAAGLAGLMKIVLSLKNNLIPGNLHFQRLSTHINLNQIPAVVAKHNTPWKPNGQKRRAGVSSFGFSGTNAHVLLEEAPSHEEELNERGTNSLPQLLCLSAKSKKALTKLAEKYSELLEATPLDINDICYTANVCRTHFDNRACFYGDSKEGLTQALKAFIEDKEHADIMTGKGSSSGIVFLFSGQGSQYLEMGKALYDHIPHFREHLDACAEILKNHLDIPLFDLLYPKSGTQDVLHMTCYTQPVLFSIEYALAQFWMKLGLKPSLVLGHSVGEVAAACVAGHFSFEDGLRMIASRGRLMQDLKGEGAMAAVMASEESVRKAIRPFGESVSIAAVNGPNLVTLSGMAKNLNEILDAIDKQGFRYKRLNVSHAFHSSQMDEMLDAFEKKVSEVRFRTSQIPLVSNLTGEVISDDEISQSTYWRRHAREEVKFYSGINTAYERGGRVFLEVGPGTGLISMGRTCIEDECLFLPSMRKGQNDLETIVRSIGEMFVHGISISWSEFYSDKSKRRKVLLPTYPFERQSYWLEKPSESSEKAIEESISSNHPLLGAEIESPLREGEVTYQKILRTDSLPLYLKDHIVFGQVVFPASGFVEMAISGCQRQLKSERVSIEDLHVLQPLVFQPGESFEMQTVLTPQGHGEVKFEILSRRSSDRKWRPHVAGHAKPTRDIRMLKMKSSLETGEPVSVTEMYRSLFDLGLQLGPAFKPVDQILIEQLSLVGRVNARGRASHDNLYYLMPNLLDGCFQVAAAYYCHRNTGKWFLPVSFEKIEVLGQPLGLLRCDVTVLEGGGASDSKYKVDLQVFNEKEHLVLDIKGFTLIEAKKEQFEKWITPPAANFQSAVYEMQWLDSLTSNEDKPTLPTEVWIVVKDQRGFSNQVEQCLKSKSQLCFSVEPQWDEADWLTAIGKVIDSSQTQINLVYLASLDAKSDFQIKKGVESTSSLLEDHKHSYLGPLSLVKALITFTDIQKFRLHFVTQNGQAVDSADRELNLAQSSIWGLGRVIDLEVPDLFCKRVDVGFWTAGSEEYLVRELIRNDGENQVALRASHRKVARLKRSSSERKGQPRFSPDFSYLITGGLGGLGIEMADWLVGRGVKNLILLSRRPPDESSRKKILELESKGIKMLSLQCDVAVLDEVDAAFAKIKKSAPPLKGVFHLAGALADAAIENQNWEKFQTVFRAKIAGSWNLHEATKDIALDFFVLFSSASSLLGNVGQANYAAANSFIDALAHYRRSQSLPGLAIAWGPWESRGMAAESAAAQRSLQEAGYEPLALIEGFELLAQVMEYNTPNVAVLK